MLQILEIVLWLGTGGAVVLACVALGMGICEDSPSFAISGCLCFLMLGASLGFLAHSASETGKQHQEADTQQKLDIALVQRPDTTSQELLRLADDGSPAVKRVIAASAHPAAADAQIRLVEDLSVDVRETLAANIHAPPEVFEMLSTDKEPDVREAVINNSAVSKKLASAAARSER